MPLTVFDIKGVPGNLRERIDAAVVEGGRRAKQFTGVLPSGR